MAVGRYRKAKDTDSQLDELELQMEEAYNARAWEDRKKRCCDRDNTQRASWKAGKRLPYHLPAKPY